MTERSASTLRNTTHVALIHSSQIKVFNELNDFATGQMGVDHAGLAGLSLVSNNPKSNLAELKHRTPKGQPVGGGTQHPLLALCEDANRHQGQRSLETIQSCFLSSRAETRLTLFAAEHRPATIYFPLSFSDRRSAFNRKGVSFGDEGQPMAQLP